MNCYTEKTPIPAVEAPEDRLGSPILSPEEDGAEEAQKPALFDRVYSDSDEEREYQVNNNHSKGIDK